MDAPPPAVASTRSTGGSMRSPEVLDHFLADLSWVVEAMRNAQQHVERHIAPRFNLFDYVDLDENKISDVLRDLLDPKGRHGQGGVFLKHFLAVLEASAWYETQASVRREVATTHIRQSNRRMDILVHLHGRGIAIENKPWAGDQKDQIKDYVAELEKRYGLGQFQLVYLTARDEDPSSIPRATCVALKESSVLRVCEYGTWLVPLLQGFRASTSSERVRWFLMDFESWVSARFGRGSSGENTMTDRRIMVEYLLKDPERLAMATAIQQAYPEVQRRIIRDFVRILVAELQQALGAGWDVGAKALVEDDPLRTWAGLYFTGFPINHLCKIGLFAEHEGATGFCSGVAFTNAPRVPSPFEEQLHEFLNARRGKGRKSQNWEWYKSLSGEFLHWTGDTLVDLRRQPQEAANQLAEHLLDIRLDVLEFFRAHPEFAAGRDVEPPSS